MKTLLKMDKLIVHIKCGSETFDLDFSQRLNYKANNLPKFIFNKFGVKANYYQIVRNGNIHDINIDNIKLLADFKFMDDDILYINNPHAKATKSDMIGDISVNFMFDNTNVNVLINKQDNISDLYWMVKKETSFDDNFCLKYQGKILNRSDKITVFESGIVDGSTIKICGNLIYNNCN